MIITHRPKYMHDISGLVGDEETVKEGNSENKNCVNTYIDVHSILDWFTNELNKEGLKYYNIRKEKRTKIDGRISLRLQCHDKGLVTAAKVYGH